jgi:hypothetical protein
MIITRMALDRRTFVRGIGATIALPFLDAMVPALSAAPAPPQRLGFFYVPNGMYLPNFHPAGAGGTAFELTPVLEPLRQFREQIVVLSGLSNGRVFANDEGGGVHTRAHCGWLTGTRPKRTEGGDITSAKTVDQYAADKLGADTSLRSLELTLESNFQVGSCESGYSCAYMNSTSWRTPTTPLPHEGDPRVVFQRLFGDGGSVTARMDQMRKDRSLLDSAMESVAALKKRLGIADQQVLSDYLESVRDVEQRIQRAERTSAASPLPAVVQPMGVPDEYDAHAKLLLDLLVVAFQGDITRVSCMQFGREQSNRTYPDLGVREAHHSVSHHQQDPHNIQQKTRIDVYNMSLFARFLGKLKETREGDGSLLEHSIFLYGAGMGDPDRHTPIDLPAVLAGGGGGRLAGGRHLRYPLNTPFMNLALSLLDKVDVPLDALADSTGRLTDL